MWVQSSDQYDYLSGQRLGVWCAAAGEVQSLGGGVVEMSPAFGEARCTHY
jgi:hypothetical protein